MFVEVRDARGKLLFKYDPARQLIQIKCRGEVITVDLSMYHKQELAEPRNEQ
jgi:hypothetical protein